MKKLNLISQRVAINRKFSQYTICHLAMIDINSISIERLIITLCETGALDPKEVIETPYVRPCRQRL